VSDPDNRGFLSFVRINKGPWQAFERAIARLFEHQGWPHVALIGGSGDHGGDIIVSNEYLDFIVQVKFKNNSSSIVQKSAIGELRKAMDHYKINQGYLVTNTKLSPIANEYVHELNKTGYKIEKIEGLDLLYYYQKLDSLPAKEFVPYTYQMQVIDSLWETYTSRTKTTLVALATGLGKTFVAGTFLKRVLHDKPDARILVLADQKALIQQFEKSLWKHLPKEVSTHIWDGNEEPSYHSGITLATFQKLINVANLDHEIGSFDVIIVDEAHHAPSPTYNSLIDKLEYNFLLGMTATPWRSDKSELQDLFGAPCRKCTIDIIEALKKGYLSKVDYRLLCDNIDYDLVHNKSTKKYTIKDLNKKLFLSERDDKILDIIIKEWEQHTIKRAIIYCASIDHAQRMEDLLRERGYLARCLHSTLDSRESEDRLRKFRQGKIQILTAMNMLNEGVDVPEVDLIVFLRVTHSRIIFLQQLGRGLRLSEGKEKVIVLDFVADLKRIAATLDINYEVCKDKDKEYIQDSFGVKFSSEIAQSFFEEYLKDKAKYVQDYGDDDLILFPS
jgi:superfamily II DNA or RNA helicase